MRILNILYDERSAIAIVNGGPGTGKTTVLLELALALAKQGKRILISSHSNRLSNIHASKLLEMRAKLKNDSQYKINKYYCF